MINESLELLLFELMTAKKLNLKIGRAKKTLKVAGQKKTKAQKRKFIGSTKRKKALTVGQVKKMARTLKRNARKSKAKRMTSIRIGKNKFKGKRKVLARINKRVARRQGRA